MTEQTDHVLTFRRLHRPGEPVVLVNVWDAASARLVVAAGAPAIASTSAGVCWSLGVPDGDEIGRADALAAVDRIVRAVEVPVSADIESGYGSNPDEVAATVRAVAALGAAGINLEDGTRDTADQCDRIAALAGINLYVNARIDMYLRGKGGLAETVARAAAYLEAGADGIFVPGVSDAPTIATLVKEIAAPINVMAGPGSLPVAALADLGVARISLGASVAEAAYAVAARAAAETYTTGTYASIADGLGYASLNQLMRT